MTEMNPRAIFNSCLLMALLLQAAGCATEKSNQAAAPTYTNPVVAEDVPDPTIKKFGDYYYVFGTTADRRLPDGRIFTALRSRDLVHWDRLGGALTPPSDNPNYQYWAPEIAESDGTYYLYYAMGGVEPEHFVLRVATSAQPQGPFTDTGVILT